MSKQAVKTGKSRFTLFKDIYDELKKVNWPTRKEGMRLTLMVIIVCVVVGIFLGAIDLGFSELIKRVFLGG
ncbi:MAG: preprotein translocase subunit SecE [Chloroflexi bacterium RBG_16_48_7]|nr:MAG: preprotein translocase subunit SecE [Chloroflexi bacterium RBG_16_48_7]